MYNVNYSGEWSVEYVTTTKLMGYKFSVFELSDRFAVISTVYKYCLYCLWGRKRGEGGRGRESEKRRGDGVVREDETAERIIILRV